MGQMIDRKTWEDFYATGLLWWVNRVLHLFGWAIVVEVRSDDSISVCYPARVKFRGFDTDTEEENFKKLSKYLEENATELRKECD